jgi:hypothetical protein
MTQAKLPPTFEGSGQSFSRIFKAKKLVPGNICHPKPVRFGMQQYALLGSIYFHDSQVVSVPIHFVNAGVFG